MSNSLSFSGKNASVIHVSFFLFSKGIMHLLHYTIFHIKLKYQFHFGIIWFLQFWHYHSNISIYLMFIIFQSAHIMLKTFYW